MNKKNIGFMLFILSGFLFIFSELQLSSTFYLFLFKNNPKGLDGIKYAGGSDFLILDKGGYGAVYAVNDYFMGFDRLNGLVFDNDESGKNIALTKMFCTQRKDVCQEYLRKKYIKYEVRLDGYELMYFMKDCEAYLIYRGNQESASKYQHFINGFIEMNC